MPAVEQTVLSAIGSRISGRLFSSLRWIHSTEESPRKDNEIALPWILSSTKIQGHDFDQQSISSRNFVQAINKLSKGEHRSEVA